MLPQRHFCYEKVSARVALSKYIYFLYIDVDKFNMMKMVFEQSV